MSANNRKCPLEYLQCSEICIIVSKMEKEVLYMEHLVLKLYINITVKACVAFHMG